MEGMEPWCFEGRHLMVHIVTRSLIDLFNLLDLSKWFDLLILTLAKSNITHGSLEIVGANSDTYNRVPKPSINPRSYD